MTRPPPCSSSTWASSPVTCNIPAMRASTARWRLVARPGPVVGGKVAPSWPGSRRIHRAEGSLGIRAARKGKVWHPQLARSARRGAVGLTPVSSHSPGQPCDRIAPSMALASSAAWAGFAAPDRSTFRSASR